MCKQLDRSSMIDETKFNLYVQAWTVLAILLYAISDSTFRILSPAVIAGLRLRIIQRSPLVTGERRRMQRRWQPLAAGSKPSATFHRGLVIIIPLATFLYPIISLFWGGKIVKSFVFSITPLSISYPKSYAFGKFQLVNHPLVS